MYIVRKKMFTAIKNVPLVVILRLDTAQVNKDLCQKECDIWSKLKRIVISVAALERACKIHVREFATSKLVMPTCSTFTYG